MTQKPYLRKKGDKFIIEKKIREDGRPRTIYLGTLPPLKDVLEWLASRKASKSHKATNRKTSQEGPKTSGNADYANLEIETPFYDEPILDEPTKEEMDDSLKEILE